MKVSSPAFKNEDFIPEKYTCDGMDVSPPLEWDPVPNAKSYALIVEDPDAPGGTFIHWVMYNITTTHLPEGVKKTVKTEYGIPGHERLRQDGLRRPLSSENSPCP